MLESAATMDSSAGSFSVAFGDTYKFTGKERDTETGLDYFGARYYGSNIGRWMSPDWLVAQVCAVLFGANLGSSPGSLASDPEWVSMLAGGVIPDLLLTFWRSRGSILRERCVDGILRRAGRDSILWDAAAEKAGVEEVAEAGFRAG